MKIAYTACGGYPTVTLNMSSAERDLFKDTDYRVAIARPEPPDDETYLYFHLYGDKEGSLISEKREGITDLGCFAQMNAKRYPVGLYKVPFWGSAQVGSLKKVLKTKSPVGTQLWEFKLARHRMLPPRRSGKVQTRAITHRNGNGSSKEVVKSRIITLPPEFVGKNVGIMQLPESDQFVVYVKQG